MPLRILLLVSIFFTVFSAISIADTFPTLLKKLKPSVVGIGQYNPLGSPRSRMTGTGFVVKNKSGQGVYVVTNYHVVSKPLNHQQQEHHVVLSGVGRDVNVIAADIIIQDEKHDLAVLKLRNNKSLPAMTLANSDWQLDGSAIAFTGFPIGSVLGLHPVTNHGYISARTPVAIPADNTTQISAARLRALRDPYYTYQLDATAYPGNSGSAVYLKSTGEVIAIVNQVHVKTTKENVLKDPSNITYAIPVKHLHDLLNQLD